MITDNENLLYYRFDEILQKLVSGYETAVDIGCGSCGHTKGLRIKHILYNDIEWPKDDNIAMRFLQTVHFIQGDALEVIRERGSFDVLIALDFLEHLPKEKAQELFDLLDEREVKRRIFFCPTGEETIDRSKEVNPDHLSLWTPEEFEAMGYEVWYCPNYHPTLGIGAFLAWNTKE